jgi:MurNAc alpha-1-phosphate uridylyltransferase
MKALILAAGLGTRMKPFTDEHPKALAPVNGKPVLQRNIEWLQQFGILEVIVNVHHFANQIIDAVDGNNGWGSKITISDETSEVLETGGGIKKASWFLQQDEFALVMNADILTDLPLGEMIEFHKLHKPLATLATTARNTSRYLLFEQRVQTGNNLSLCGWKNITTNELKGTEGIPKAFSGIQILSREIFDLIPFSGKFSMIDVYLSLSKHPILSFDHSQAKLVDIGTVQKLAQAERLFP